MRKSADRELSMQRLGETAEFKSELERLADLAPAHVAVRLRKIAEVA